MYLIIFKIKLKTAAMAMLTPGGDAVCRTTDIMSDAAYGKQAKNQNS